MKRIEEFDFVEILSFTGKEFDDDRISEVINVDGAYILVKRNISGVESELYPNELRLLEGDESDMAYFQRNMWRGLRTPEQNQAWLAEGYMREEDWEAAQEENVTMSYVDNEKKDSIFIQGNPRNNNDRRTRLNLLNDRCQKEVADQEFVHKVKDFILKHRNIKNYDRANEVIKK